MKVFNYYVGQVPVCCHVKVVGMDQSYRIFSYSNPKPLRGYNLTLQTHHNLTSHSLAS